MHITAIIPTYKPGDYLLDCLKSIEAQTFSSYQYEVIVILNGCKEPYLNMIENYQRHLLRIKNLRIIQTDLPGVSNARNIGIDNAKGDYITFIDDDDIISPSFFEGLIQISTPECVGCGYSLSFKESITDSHPNFLTKAYNNNKEQSFGIYKYRAFLSPPWCKLIHKSIIADCRYPTNLRKSEDSVFCLEISHRIKEMKLADENTVYYQRQRAGSVMRVRNSFTEELKCFLKLEYEYFIIWLKHPFRYNILFLLSRMIAGIRNFLSYIK